MVTPHKNVISVRLLHHVTSSINELIDKVIRPFKDTIHEWKGSQETFPIRTLRKTLIHDLQMLRCHRSIYNVLLKICSKQEKI